MEVDKLDFISNGIRDYFLKKGENKFWDKMDLAIKPIMPLPSVKTKGAVRRDRRGSENLFPAYGSCEKIELHKLSSQIFKWSFLCRESFTLIYGLFKGNFLGFFIDSNSLPVKDGQIDLREGGRILSSASTNQQGMFIFEKIKPSKYILGVKHHSKVDIEFEIEVSEPTLSEPLQKFIERDCRIFFMPIVSLFNGKIYGYEALARATNEDRFPVELFAEAEALGTNIVAKLNLACIKKAIEEVKKPRFPEGKKLFLNVTPSTFEFEEFHSFFGNRNLLISPWNIVFEIIEKPINDMLQFKKDVTPLFLAGYNFATDDQGTDGAYDLRLLELRTRYVKADWQFVNRSLEKNDLQILDGYQEFAKDHNGLMVLEGVSDEWGIRDLRKFYDRKVSFGQGFLFGKAKPIEEIDIEIPRKARELLETVWQ